MWPTQSEIDALKSEVASCAGVQPEEVNVVVSPYRVCPLGAHIDHQGGPVTAVAVDLGVLLAFATQNSPEIQLASHNFDEKVCFNLREVQERAEGEKVGGVNWGAYVRGAVLALKARGHELQKGLVGVVKGADGADGGGISSSAAFGCAILLALEHANDLQVNEQENIKLDQHIENVYMGLKNGILDQSAILLSRACHLTAINCRDYTHKLVPPPWLGSSAPVKFMLAFSGIRQPLAATPGYNMRVDECTSAARILQTAVARPDEPALLGTLTIDEFNIHRGLLDNERLRRAEHFFGECQRVHKGIEAWSAGDMVTFGKLMSQSGESSITKYECGSEPLIQLREILLNTKGVLGARFSGAGFRGCCVALVDAGEALLAVEEVKSKYAQVQPELAAQGQVLVLD
eukprot:CAMPEP_0118924096 /NCGR_PEP_ID=MMETSP1169-20130426/2386_1 /TAXON_ID=36882 /ORGANISM="Pyramimonas obovata, Strain CCMP722" /LENGTH=402 /DNA_ID=CAMNT_0006865179 /DNA_START=96 /DNA_END=1301 /DNA_ORIENTATION=+